MTSPAEQSALYARLQEVLGPEPAATLMTMFPSGDDLATRADIADLRGELKEELREMRVMIRGYDEALRGYVRTFVVAQVATVVGVTGIVLGIERLG